MRRERSLCESLESRRLLSFSANLSSGGLNVQNDAQNDQLNVEEDNGNVHVFGSSFADEQFFTGVTNIQIFGNVGNDTISYDGNSIGASIHGNAGADYIKVIDRGSGQSAVQGDSGNDVLTLVVANAQGGRSTLDGGSGDDVIYVNTGYGTAPFDTYNFASAQALVICSSGTDRVSTYAGNTTINGGSGDDTVLVFVGTGVNTYINVENVVPS